MEAIRREALELIRALKEIAPQQEPLLASSDDCAYFRSLYRPQQKKEPEPAAPPPAPVPSVKAPPEKEPKIEITAPAPQPQPKSPSPSPPPERFEELRALFAKIAPRMRLLDEIPKDDEAKQISERWKTRNQASPFSLLVHQEPPSHLKLLENLAEALEVVFGGARLIRCASIEKEKQWEAFLSVPTLRTVIICDSTLWQLPNLLQYYREVPSHSERFLHNAPLFLLPDLSLYLKDPLLKRSLWKSLCQKIA